jgi:hypothetical protein
MGTDFICPRIIGGLGNQLFILMTAYAFAKDEKTKFVIDPRNYAACPGRKVNTYWDTFLISLRPFVQWGRRPKPDNVVKETRGFIYRKLRRRQKGRTQLKGYFQSYKYFEKYRKDILSLFELDPVTYSYFNSKYPWLDLRSSKLYKETAEAPKNLLTNISIPEAADAANAADVANAANAANTADAADAANAAYVPQVPLVIGVHVRHGDYVLKGHYVLPITYYERCLDLVKDQVVNELKSGKTVMAAIFTDDFKWCESVLLPMMKNYFASFSLGTSEICGTFDAFIITGEKDHHELQMMEYCDILFLANSTFSWWGAYLNRKPDTRVFLPFRWFTAAHPCPPELVYTGWNVVQY